MWCFVLALFYRCFRWRTTCFIHHSFAGFFHLYCENRVRITGNEMSLKSMGRTDPFQTIANHNKAHTPCIIIVLYPTLLHTLIVKRTNKLSAVCFISRFGNILCSSVCVRMTWASFHRPLDEPVDSPHKGAIMWIVFSFMTSSSHGTNKLWVRHHATEEILMYHSDVYCNQSYLPPTPTPTPQKPHPNPQSA